MCVPSAEFDDFHTLQFFMFFFGIVTVMLGVMGLAPDDTPKVTVILL